MTVFDDAASPPQFSISLTPTDEICHLSGTPRFGFELKITSHDKDTITVCLDKTPLKELHGLEEIVKVVVEDTGDEVEWPYSIGCWEDDDAFPSDDMFEEFEPGVPYREMFWLDPFNKETSNDGELDVLEAKSKYAVEVNKSLSQCFSKWRRGSKQELLSGGEDDKKERWNGVSGEILLQWSDSVTFRTV